MTLVKFCGMTRAEDVDAACALGADAVGFVLWSKSPRAVPLDRIGALVRAVPAAVLSVGVFVDPSRDELHRALDAGLRALQIHGTAADVPAGVPVWRAASLESDLAAIDERVTLLLDAHDPERHGGTGRTIDWTRAAEVARRRRVVLAGGLRAENVAAAIATVRPYGVDVASGIEDQPGIKNAHAMRAFVAAVRGTEQ